MRLMLVSLHGRHFAISALFPTPSLFPTRGCLDGPLQAVTGGLNCLLLFSHI